MSHESFRTSVDLYILIHQYFHEDIALFYEFVSLCCIPQSPSHINCAGLRNPVYHWYRYNPLLSHCKLLFRYKSAEHKLAGLFAGLLHQGPVFFYYYYFFFFLYIVEQIELTPFISGQSLRLRHQNDRNYV